MREKHHLHATRTLLAAKDNQQAAGNVAPRANSGQNLPKVLDARLDNHMHLLLDGIARSLCQQRHLVRKLQTLTLCLVLGKTISFL
jgi:hypothetical protein